MDISADMDIAAWSPDGGSALVRRVEAGPEGGARRVWLVVNAAGATTFTVSSTLSPGDGSTPEGISDKQCRAEAAQLARRLVSFEGVKVRPERCAGRRDALVEIDAERQARAAASWNPEDTRVTCLFKRLRVAREDVEIEVVRVDERCPADLRWASTGPLVLVVGSDGTDASLLAAVVQTKTEFFTVNSPPRSSEGPLSRPRPSPMVEPAHSRAASTGAPMRPTDPRRVLSARSVRPP